VFLLSTPPSHLLFLYSSLLGASKPDFSAEKKKNKNIVRKKKKNRRKKQ
jgi:hypothetical protein